MKENQTEFGTYTSWPARKTFNDEKRLVKTAFETGEEEILKNYLTPLVEHWFEEFKKNHSHISWSSEESIKAGFSYLDLAIKNYLKRLEEGETGFKFSTYFEWFIRKGFSDYIQRGSTS